MLVMAIAMMSCSKKVEVKGNFAGGSPLERIEFIEASGIATLPLVNMGVDSKGSFSGNFEAPNDGMYLITYAGKTAMIYLKAGQELNISGQAAAFPNLYTITGDAKNNNDFLRDVQKSIQDYASQLNVGELVAKKEGDFLKEIDKIHAELSKRVEASGKKTSADKDAINWKLDELNASVLGLMSQYETSHPQASQNPTFKVSKAFREAEAKFVKDEKRLLETQPLYRNYLLAKLNQEFQAFATKKNPKPDPLSSEVFAEFLDTKKDLSQLTKDYLLAFVLSSSDLTPGMSVENSNKLSKVISEKIKDSKIKKDLEKIKFVISGPKIGEAAPAPKLVKADGNAYKLSDAKAKPTLVMFYASWNPYIAEGTVPVLREVIKFYQSKMDFTFVNMDDTKEQFAKTSKAMFQGISATNVYAEGGLASTTAEDYGIYGFKMPSFIIVDKNGKVASRFFYNFGDPELVAALDKITGLKAPVVEPQIQLQNDLLTPPTPEQERAPVEDSPAPAAGNGAADAPKDMTAPKK